MSARAYFFVLIGFFFSECIFSLDESSSKPAEISPIPYDLDGILSKKDYISYIKTLGLPESAWLSLRAVEEASENQSSHRKYQTGLLLKDEKHHLLAALWFLQAANQDNGHAHFQLGVLYEEGAEHADEGESIKKDVARAGYHYSQAAKLGICEARKKLKNPELARLGREMGMNKNYEFGLSLKKLGFDFYAEAFKYFQEAAREGHGLAKYHIGSLYEEGFLAVNSKGIPTLIKKMHLAIMYYKSAAELGVQEAQQKLEDLKCQSLL